jgi:hypothetical protein
MNHNGTRSYQFQERAKLSRTRHADAKGERKYSDYIFDLGPLDLQKYERNILLYSTTVAYYYYYYYYYYWNTLKL